MCNLFVLPKSTRYCLSLLFHKWSFSKTNARFSQFRVLYAYIVYIHCSHDFSAVKCIFVSSAPSVGIACWRTRPIIPFNVAAERMHNVERGKHGCIVCSYCFAVAMLSRCAPCTPTKAHSGIIKIKKKLSKCQKNWNEGWNYNYLRLYVYEGVAIARQMIIIWLAFVYYYFAICSEYSIHTKSSYRGSDRGQSVCHTFSSEFGLNIPSVGDLLCRIWITVLRWRFTSAPLPKLDSHNNNEQFAAKKWKKNLCDHESLHVGMLTCWSVVTPNNGPQTYVSNPFADDSSHSAHRIWQPLLLRRIGGPCAVDNGAV